MSQTNILIPIGSFFPDTSNGPSVSVYQLSKELSKNFSIKVLTTTELESDKRFLDHNERLEVEYFHSKAKKFPFPLFVGVLKRIYNCDAVLITSFFFPVSIWTLLLARLFKKKVMLSPRGEFYENALTSGNILKKLLLPIMVKIVKQNVIFHATNAEEKSQILDLFGSGVEVFISPNGLTFERNKKIGSLSESKHVLFLGRCHPDKNLDTLLRAFAISRVHLNYDAKLIITGDSETKYGRKLQKLAAELGLSDFVEFPGYVFGPKKEEYLNKAKVLCLVSKSENFGNVVVEALAEGTPVIATKGTPWETLNEYGAGYFVNQSEDEIAKAICKIYEMKDEEYSKMTASSIELAAGKYHIETTVQDWLEIIKNII